MMLRDARMSRRNADNEQTPHLHAINLVVVKCGQGIGCFADACKVENRVFATHAEGVHGPVAALYLLRFNKKDFFDGANVEEYFLHAE